MNSSQPSTVSSAPATSGVIRRTRQLIPWCISAFLGIGCLYLGFGWWDACIKIEALQTQASLAELKAKDVEQKLTAEIIISREQIERIRALEKTLGPKK